MRLILCCLLLCTSLLDAQLIGDKQSGLASYYSTEYDGAETAYGTIYNKNELVAAHKAFPYNSTVRVRNEENGKSVVVRIVDKGPFIRGRIVELSERAAAEIDMLGQRTVPVELTLLSTPDQPSGRTVPAYDPPPSDPEPVRQPTRAASEAPAVEPPRPTPPPPSPAVTEPAPAPQSRTVPPPAPAERGAAVPRAKPAKTFAPGVYRIQLTEPDRGRYAVQVGSFSELERAMDKVTELQGRYFDDILLSREGRSTFKVLLGPFRDRSSAQNYASDLQRRYNIKGFAVDMGEKYP